MKKVVAIIGAAVAGFAAGILTAPKSGKETRADLKRKADEYRDEAEKRAGQAKAAAQDSVESIKSGARKVGGVATETARDVRDKAGGHFKESGKK